MDLTIPIFEQQLLKLYIENENDITLPTENYFVSDNGREFFDILTFLSQKNYIFSKEHILQNVKEFVNAEVYSKVMECEYQLDKVEDYQNKLREKYYFNKIHSDILKRLTKESGKKEVNKEDLNKIVNELNQNMKSMNSSGNSLLPMTDYLAQQKNILSERMKGQALQSSGCFLLDTMLPASSLHAGLGVIFGYPASGKSTMNDYFILQRFLKNLPTLSINLEMAHESKIDSYICALCELDYYEVKGANNEDHTLDQHVIDKYEEMLTRFKYNDRLYVETKQSLSVHDVINVIKQSRQRMDLREDEILWVSIDLLTMLKEFRESQRGMNHADVINNVLDYLNEIALEYNCFIFCVVQPLRPNKDIKVNTLDDLEKLRPPLQTIKGSGAFEERARFILSVYNPLHQGKKYMSDNPALETLQPVIELMSVKDTHGSSTGKIIKYLHLGNTRRVRPYFETEAEYQELLKKRRI